MDLAARRRARLRGGWLAPLVAGAFFCLRLVWLATLALEDALDVGTGSAVWPAGALRFRSPPV